MTLTSSCRMEASKQRHQALPEGSSPVPGVWTSFRCRWSSVGRRIERLDAARWSCRMRDRDVVVGMSESVESKSMAQDHERQLWKEAVTMSLYVAICLLAALTAVADEVLDHDDVVEIVWGSTLGLALAHWFAFQISARLAGSGSVARHDAQSALAQLLGAGAVAMLVTVPVLVLQRPTAFGVARLVLAVFIGGVGFVVARSSGGSRPRAIAYGVSVLVLALVVAVVKNTLVGY